MSAVRYGVGIDLGREHDATVIAVLGADGLIRLTSFVERVTPALRAMAAGFQRLGRQAAIASRAVRRMQRPPRSGGRHRGTAAWQLRAAPASSMPLGQRTAAKRRALRGADPQWPGFQPGPSHSLQPFQREILRRSFEVTPTGIEARTLTLR